VSPTDDVSAHSKRPGLARRLRTFDAVVIGLGAMIGAGIFAALSPAADAAGSGLLVGLAIAAAVACCNAASSAQLAAVYPESGGAYAYGRHRLGEVWGFVAGWGFAVGKTASCAAMALTFGAYAAPEFGRSLAVAAVLALATINYRGIESTARATRVVVALVLASLAAVVAGALFGGEADIERLRDPLAGGAVGILESAGLLFFAFAGYARIATLGEEVESPERTIPRAIPLALGITVVVYAIVAVSALLAAGPGELARSTAPLAAATESGSLSWLTPVVRIGGSVASLGVLLSLLAGVSRTIFAMARDDELPRWFSAVHPRFQVPHHAELAVASLVVCIVLLADVRGAIGFSAFSTLVYYGIANASASTLPAEQRRWPRIVPALGLAGCLLLAFSLPLPAWAGGVGVLAFGLTVRMVRRRFEGIG